MYLTFIIPECSPWTLVFVKRWFQVHWLQLVTLPKHSVCLGAHLSVYRHPELSGSSENISGFPSAMSDLPIHPATDQPRSSDAVSEKHFNLVDVGDRLCLEMDTVSFHARSKHTHINTLTQTRTHINVHTNMQPDTHTHTLNFTYFSNLVIKGLLKHEIEAVWSTSTLINNIFNLLRSLTVLLCVVLMGVNDKKQCHPFNTQSKHCSYQQSPWLVCYRRQAVLIRG